MIDKVDLKQYQATRGGNIYVKGRFGAHGGQYIPETLMNAVLELEEAYNHYKMTRNSRKNFTILLNEYAGRPSRLYYAGAHDKRISAEQRSI